MANFGTLQAVLALLALPRFSAASERPATDYLSDFSFPGLHIIERDGETLRIFPNGHHRADPLIEQMGALSTMKEARQVLERTLKIPSREPLQSSWAMFDQQGHRLKKVEALRNLKVIFVLEIGQWMWPAVSPGFVHLAEGVSGDIPKRLRTLSVRPVVFEVEDFIEPNECDEVKRLGEARGLETSKGMLQSADIAKGTADEEFRTSQQAWLYNDEGKVISKLDERTANLTRVDASHNEPVQLLRYGEGNYYHGHMDWTELELYPDQKEVWLDAHYGYQDRLATVFWYLNTVERGGETIFPKHGQPICPAYEQRNCHGAHDPDMTSCAEGLTVAPKLGTVILWYNFHPSGRGDRNSLHAGCPVGKGLVKWSGNKWVNIKPVQSPQAKWIPDHPALKRMGFSEIGNTNRHATDPSGCVVTFVNGASESVDIQWLENLAANPGQNVGNLNRGATTSLASSKGHMFKLKGVESGRESSVATCKGNETSFYLSTGFKLRKRPTKQGSREL